MLQKSITNSLETNEKIENLNKERNHKDQMETIGLKNIRGGKECWSTQ